MADGQAQAVLMTGTIGTGKTAVASEMGELLEGRGVAVAIIDLDWLGWFHHLPGQGPTPDELIVQNLRVVWPNFDAAGARYLVMTRAITEGGQVEAIRGALADVELRVALLTTPPELIADRLRRRDTGAILAGHLEESAAMALSMGDLQADLSIVNDDRPIRDVAEELITKLGWT